MKTETGGKGGGEGKGGGGAEGRPDSMATVYVQRSGGLVTGVYVLPQPGLAEEAISDAHPDVLAYLAGPPSAQLLADARAAAKALLLLSNYDLPTALRAVALAAGDGDNMIRQWVTDFKAAAAASTSLADFKTRVAALSNLPQITAQNAKNAVRDRIDTSDSD